MITINYYALLILKHAIPTYLTLLNIETNH